MQASLLQVLPMMETRSQASSQRKGLAMETGWGLGTWAQHGGTGEVLLYGTVGGLMGSLVQTSMREPWVNTQHVQWQRDGGMKD